MLPTKRPRGGESHLTAHVNHAERFMIFARAMDAVDVTRGMYVQSLRRSSVTAPREVEGERYVVTILRVHLKRCIVGNGLTRSGHVHVWMPTRHKLPTVLHEPLAENGYTAVNAEVSWIVCYLARNFPDTTKVGWQQFECSHLCAGAGVPEGMRCVQPECLHWESKSLNQSRGYGFCHRICLHSRCRQHLCMCQRLHDPPCR